MSKQSVGRLFAYLQSDIPASVVVFFVALPLCLGIALASGAPLMGGLVAGMAGGIVAGIISGSHTSVSGPAAGLAVIISNAIAQLGSYELFLVAVVWAGILQIVFGLLRLGSISDFVPGSVVKGMLAAIGLILILKQIQHALGYDADFEGNESLLSIDGNYTWSFLLDLSLETSPGAICISFVSVTVLVLSESFRSKWPEFLIHIHPSVWVVLLAIVTNEFILPAFDWRLSGAHLVQLPDFSKSTSFSFPQFQHSVDALVWLIALKMAVVASLETLLNIEASDKLDKQLRYSPPSRELLAQGSANIVSGMLGGLPVTAVIVRSSANMMAGNKTKISTIFHGVWILLAVWFIPSLLNRVPLSALAVILMMVGYKLCKPELFLQIFRMGRTQFIPFMASMLLVLFGDLLLGVCTGVLLACILSPGKIMAMPLLEKTSANRYKILFPHPVNFLHKQKLRKLISQIPRGSQLTLDFSSIKYIDPDISEMLSSSTKSGALNSPVIEIKVSHNSPESST